MKRNLNLSRTASCIAIASIAMTAPAFGAAPMAKTSAPGFHRIMLGA